MTEEKIGRKPDDKVGGRGGEKDPGANAEVAGREKHKLIYTCFACGSQNYVDPSWTYFTCWKCGPTLNYIN